MQAKGRKKGRDAKRVARLGRMNSARHDVVTKNNRFGLADGARRAVDAIEESGTRGKAALTGRRSPLPGPVATSRPV